jgi:hypothetical protein
MPAVGALVRCTDSSWMTRPPQNCPAGHRLDPGRMLVGDQPCSTCRWTHDLDVPGVRCGGLWAGADRRLSDSRRRGGGAVTIIQPRRFQLRGRVNPTVNEGQDRR